MNCPNCDQSLVKQAQGWSHHQTHLPYCREIARLKAQRKRLARMLALCLKAFTCFGTRVAYGNYLAKEAKR